MTQECGFTIHSQDVLSKVVEGLKQKDGTMSFLCGRNGRLYVRCMSGPQVGEILFELSQPHFTCYFPLSKSHKTDFCLHFFSVEFCEAIKSHFAAYHSQTCHMDFYSNKVVFMTILDSGERCSVTINSVEAADGPCIFTAADASQQIDADGKPTPCIGNNYNDSFEYDVPIDSSQLMKALIPPKDKMFLTFYIKENESKEKGIISTYLKTDLVSTNREIKTSEAAGKILHRLSQDSENYEFRLGMANIDLIRKLLRIFSALSAPLAARKTTTDETKHAKKRRRTEAEEAERSSDEDEQEELSNNSAVLLRLSRWDPVLSSSVGIKFKNTGIKVKALFVTCSEKLD